MRRIACLLLGGGVDSDPGRAVLNTNARGLAGVGRTEDEARSQGFDIEAVTQDMSEWTVFRIAGERPAHGKVVFEKRTGRVLGAHFFGSVADTRRLGTSDKREPS